MPGVDACHLSTSPRKPGVGAAACGRAGWQRNRSFVTKTPDANLHVFVTQQ